MRAQFTQNAPNFNRLPDPPGTRDIGAEAALLDGKGA
jgi:hypothetical protein